MFSQLVRNLKNLKLNLTPHEYFITQGKGPERPFTGDFWWYKDVGTYHCKVCNTALFPSHYKFQTTSGHATFFSSLKNATKENSVDLNCSNCESHLGTASEEGPPPTYRTLTIKSASLVFKPMPFFEVPLTRNEKRKLREKQERKQQKKLGSKEEEEKVEAGKVEEHLGKGKDEERIQSQKPKKAEKK